MRLAITGGAGSLGYPLYKWVYGTADKDSFVSIERITQTLGWQPRYSNAEALISSYKWYLEHKNELSHAGITHRVGWKQGIIGFFKKFL
jgi:dTDP-D-glucose 4,6-dehydratase